MAGRVRTTAARTLPIQMARPNPAMTVIQSSLSVSTAIARSPANQTHGGYRGLRTTESSRCTMPDRDNLNTRDVVVIGDGFSKIAFRLACNQVGSQRLYFGIKSPSRDGLAAWVASRRNDIDGVVCRRAALWTNLTKPSSMSPARTKQTGGPQALVIGR